MPATVESDHGHQVLRELMTVVNKSGMHARPAAKLVDRLLEFGSDIYFIKDGHRVNAKSIMGLLTLAAAQGTQIEVMCSGSDAEVAMEAVRHMFETGFGEE